MSDMSKVQLVWFGVFEAALVVAGWFYLYRTDRIVRYARRNYENSKLIRRWPLSGIVLKSWYPALVRCGGVFMWAWAVVMIVFLALGTHRIAH